LAEQTKKNQAMPKQGSKRSTAPRKSKLGRPSRTLNAFRIGEDDELKQTREEKETLELNDEGVKSSDDEDIDSDEAFDESDEERYSTFKFSGSMSRSNQVC
jgi:U3 small nucleolar RNA-associated protein 14